MRQVYSKSELQDALQNYSIGEVEDFYLFKSGFENSNYFIKTKQGSFVIKIFEGMDVETANILFEIEIMDKVNKAGLKIPKIFPTNNGDLYAKLGNKYACLMNYVEGDNMEKYQLTDALTKEVGEEVGKIDNFLKNIKDGSKTRQNYAFDLKNFLLLEPKIEELDSRFNKTIFTKIFNDFKKNKILFDSLPTGLIHNDIVLYNILAKDGRLQAIIDFSDMAYSPYIQNVAVSIYHCFFTYNWQPRQVKVFLESYQRYNPISAQEKLLLYNLVLARSALMMIEFNYWNVKFGNDAARTELITDYYGFLKKLLKLGEIEFNKIILEPTHLI